MSVGVTIKTRRGTAAEWAAANPVLAAGEQGYETDTKLLKIGDGVTAYNSLAYLTGYKQAPVIVAGSDSSVNAKAQAHYICDGTADESEIQTAINALPVTGGKVLILKGTYNISVITGITIPSNVEIELQGTIKFITNVGNGGIIFKNSDATNGNSGIIIHGIGKLDGNRANQASPTTNVQNGIVFTKVTNSKIDIEVSGLTGLAIVTTDCGNVNVINRLYPFVNPCSRKPSLLSDLLRHKNVSVIDPIDDNDGWSAAGVNLAWIPASTLGVRFGNSMAKLYPPIGTPGTCSISKTFNPVLKIDPSYAYGVLVNMGITQYTTFNLTISFSDGTHTVTMDKITNNFITGSVNPGTGEWRLYADTVKKYEAAAGYAAMNWDAITSITITYINSSWAPITTYYALIDGLLQIKPLFPQGAIVISTDDGGTSIYQYALPIMNKYGYHGVIYTIPTELGVGQYTMTLAQLIDCYRFGWDIANHTWAHTSLASNIATGLMEEEILRCQSWLIEKGFGDRAVSLAYPEGVITPAGVSLTHTFLPISRSTPISTATAPFMSLPGFNPFGLNPFYPGVSDANLAAMKTAVDDAKKYKSCINFYLHKVEPGSNTLSNITDTGFEEFIDYINSSGVKVVTYSEILRMIKNNETDDSKLSNSGSGTIASGATTVKITHSLAGIPRNVQISLSSGLGSASSIWVSDKDIDDDGLKFQVSVNVDPAQDVTFDWSATI